MVLHNYPVTFCRITLLSHIVSQWVEDPCSSRYAPTPPLEECSPILSPLGFHPFPLRLLPLLLIRSLPLNSTLPLTNVVGCCCCVVCIVVSTAFTFHTPNSCLAASNGGGVILRPVIQTLISSFSESHCFVKY